MASDKVGNKSTSRIDRRKALAEREGSASESEVQVVKRAKVRLIPIWLRLIMVIVLIGISLSIGLMVGYGVLGEGESLDILKWSTWDYLIDFIQKDTL